MKIFTGAVNKFISLSDAIFCFTKLMNINSFLTYSEKSFITGKNMSFFCNIGSPDRDRYLPVRSGLHCSTGYFPVRGGSLM